MKKSLKKFNIVICVGIAVLIPLSVVNAEEVSNNDPNILNLASARFGALTKAEKILLEKVVIGKVADCNISSEEDNEPNNVGISTIRANLVVWLCTNRKASAMITYKGVRAENAHIKGELDLSYAKIPFPLVFKKSNFKEKISLKDSEIKELNLEGTSTREIDAESVRIDGTVYLSNGFKAEGKVNLQGAKIRCDLDCANGKFINPNANKIALEVDGANIDGSVYLRNGFRAEGWIDMRAATVRLYFVMEKVELTEKMKLSLLSTKIGTLQDDDKSWPKSGCLYLHGLVYNEIANEAQMDVSKRIDWLSRQHDFRPQPYEQLATVLRNSGFDVEAKKILIAKNKDLAKRVKLTTWIDKFWYLVLGPMIEYGYGPLNVLWGIAAFVVLGWSLFKTGYKRGLITPIDESAYVKITGSDGVSRADVQQLSDIYPKLNYFMYSVDTFVPLIDFCQARYWRPNAGHGHELFKIKGFSTRTGGLLRVYFWFHLISGWALTMLLVAGLTGLVRT